MSREEPAGQVASRSGMTSAPSAGSFSRWPPPAATSSHDQFFSVVKKARPAPTTGGVSSLGRAGPLSPAVGASKQRAAAPRPGPSKAPISLLKAGHLRMGGAVPGSAVKISSPRFTQPSTVAAAKPGPPGAASATKLFPSSVASATKLGLPNAASATKMGSPSVASATKLFPQSVATTTKLGPPGAAATTKLYPKNAASASKLGPPRAGPPAGISPKARHPSAEVRPRAPSGGVPRPAPDSFRPRLSVSAPKSRVSWDLDLLTDVAPENDMNGVSDLEQSPAFLRDDFDQKPAGAPSSSLLKTMGPMKDKARDAFPKSNRGRPPKAPGEPGAPRKYTKKKHAANGLSGHPDSFGIPRTKPKWKGASDSLHNNFSKVKEKQRRHSEKMVAVRMDGSVPQVVTLLKSPTSSPRAVSLISPGKEPPRPRLASPVRKPSGSSPGDLTHGKPEGKPLFEHIDEDWAVIKKSLEKTETKERKLSESSSSRKSSLVTLTPSLTKKSDRSEELSTDDDLGNDPNEPLLNLEKLQNQMIKSLMGDNTIAELKKKRKKQKEIQTFKKKKMSDYWKSKMGRGGSSLKMKIKRPYTMRPLTSDNIEHMEEAIAAVLAAPSPESSPEKHTGAASGGGSPPKPKLKLPGSVPPLQRRPAGPGPRIPHPSLATLAAAQPGSRPGFPPPSQPQSAAACTPHPSLSEPSTPTPGGPEQRVPTEPESDPAAAARLLRVKQELAARFLSDLHDQRAQLQAAEQQRLAWKQQHGTTHQHQQAAVQQHQQAAWRPLIRVGRRRPRSRQPRIVRLTEATIQAGNSVTDFNISDDGADDGLAPVPEVDAPPPVSMPTNKLKEFLDGARVSRYRRTCGLEALASVEMPEEVPERMVFVSERPLPPEVEQTLVPTGQGLGLPVMPGWPTEHGSPDVGWHGPPLTPVAGAAVWGGAAVSPAASVGWSGGVVSPAPGPAWPGQPTGGSTPGTPLTATSVSTPTTAPSATPATPGTAIPSASPRVARPSVTPAAAKPSAATEYAMDASMDEKPLQIVLPPSSSAEGAATPAGSAPQTPLSVSPRAAPTPTPSDQASRPGGTPVPGTPAGLSPRTASGASTTALPSPRPVEPEGVTPFACNRCPTRLATLSEQVYHEIWTHMIEEGLFRCLGCPMLVPLESDVSLVFDGLLDHYMKHVDGDGRLLPFDTSEEVFRCEFCPLMFEDPVSYGAHEVYCRKMTHTCATCQGRFKTADLLKFHEVDHLRASDGKYCCDHCDSKFTRREQLLGHRRFHFKDKNVECPTCGKKFMTTGMLAMHNKWKHSQGPCRFCGRPFTSATARQAHEEHTHLKHMMHMCDVCHFRVMTATQLRVHKRTHSGDKPHRCTACDETFVSRNLLKKHRNARHSEAGPTAADGAGADAKPAPAEPSPSQSGGESARAADGSLTPAELRQLFERYKATWTGPKDDMTLSDLDTDEDEKERQYLLDAQADEELFKTKDKNTLSVWSCPVCNAYFTKLWGVRAHITLKHPGTSLRPVLHDDKDTSAVSKQDFLKEIKRNAKTAKRELKLEAKRQARIAAYGDELPRRGRPRKYPASERPPVVRTPIDPSQPRKRGRPRKNPDDPTASPLPIVSGEAVPPAPPPPPPPPPKPEPPPDHVERRRWKCLTCEDQSQSYDDLVTHTYLAHPDADLPRFEVVVTYVPKPAPRTPAEPAPKTPPPPDAGSEAQQDRDAAILDAARVRGAEKRRAPSATKVPDGAKRRSIPSSTREGTPRGRGRGRGGRGASGGGRGSSSRRGSSSSGGRGRAASGDSYRKSYSNSSRRFRADESAGPTGAASAATDDADKLYCYCQAPYDEVSEMIGCDSDDCKHEWFHFECVGIVIAPKGKWFCPDCAGTKANK